MDRVLAKKSALFANRYGSKSSPSLVWDRARYAYQKPNIPKASGFSSMNQLINTRNLLTRKTLSILDLDTVDYMKMAPALSHFSDINMEYAFNNLPHLYLLLYQEYYYPDNEDIKESHIDRAFNKLITYNYFLKTKGLPYSLPSKLSKKQRILLSKLDTAFEKYRTSKGIAYIDEASSLSDDNIDALLSMHTHSKNKSLYYTRTPQGIK